MLMVNIYLIMFFTNIRLHITTFDLQNTSIIMFLKVSSATKMGASKLWKLQALIHHCSAEPLPELTFLIVNWPLYNGSHGLYIWV